mgnify:CR=1 FL=1
MFLLIGREVRVADCTIASWFMVHFTRPSLLNTLLLGMKIVDVSSAL